MNLQKSTEWGPIAWNAFHTNALNYPHEPENKDVRNAVNYYQKVFPQYVKCNTCKQDYMKMIRETPIRPYSKDDLFNWTVDIHNTVNHKINKPEMSYRKAYQIWNNNYYQKPNVIDRFNNYFNNQHNRSYNINPGFSNRFLNGHSPNFRNWP